MAENNGEVITTDQHAKIEFTPEQQAKIDEIVKRVMGRAGFEARQALDAEKRRATQLENDLAAALENAPNKDEVEKIRQSKLESDKRLSSLEDALIKEKKQNLVHQFGHDRFVDNQVVLAMTERNLRWDSSSQRFLVVNEDGSLRMNLSTLEPMSPAEFFTEFAREKPYMVKSDVKSGNGGTESNRSSFSNGKTTFSVDEVFGPKSDSRKASALMKQSPAEYQRLKAEARTKGLIR